MERNILVLAPHTDDGELGCGGTIVKFLESGMEVYYAAFSACEESVPEGLPNDILKEELYCATNVLGIGKENIIIYNYPVRRFYEYRQEILENMLDLNRKISPGIVMMPSPHDTHQDHTVIAAEGMRAFKHTCLLAYEEPWNNFTFNYQTFITLERHHIDRKIEALGCYKSQANRSYCKENFINGLALTHGVQAGYELAEVFETIRWII